MHTLNKESKHQYNINNIAFNITCLLLTQEKKVTEQSQTLWVHLKTVYFCTLHFAFCRKKTFKPKIQNITF